jgi:SH3-like domain-containing protein
MKKVHYLILFIFVFLMTWDTGTVAANEMVAVTKDNVNMRSGPGTNHKILWKLGKGFPLKVLQRSGAWIRVEDFEGAQGWIHRNLVNRSGHMIVKAQRNTGKKINVRSGPGTNYKVVAQAHYGVVFQTLERRRTWVKVRHGDVTGWVHRRLLWGF